MTLNDLTVNISHLNRESLLDDWEWLLKGKFLPILVSASGDAFVQHVLNSQIWWLDTAGSEFTKVADSIEEFNTLLSSSEFVAESFAVQMVGDLIQSAKSLSKGQVYSLVQPWLLGGKYNLNNIEPTDIEVHFSITGQVAQQVNTGKS